MPPVEADATRWKICQQEYNKLSVLVQQLLQSAIMHGAVAAVTREKLASRLLARIIKQLLARCTKQPLDGLRTVT